MNLPAPAAPAQHVLARTYPGTPDQVRRVRDDLRAALDGCPIADDVILCASELAANAIQHSRSRQPGGTITVRIQIAAGRCIGLRIDDDGGLWTEPAPDPARGSGLDIVRALASCFTVTTMATGRAVSAILDWPSV